MNPRVPRLRGVFHQYAFFAAIAAGVVLVVLADGMLERFAVWVYALALAAMFGASALYHRVSWRSAARALRARRLDHAMIFVFIAGTYTPFALLAFAGALASSLPRRGLGGGGPRPRPRAGVDRGSALALGRRLPRGRLDRDRGPPAVLPGARDRPAVLLLVGGALYMLGAVAYATAWPNPFPSTFGFHEVFHVLVIAAAVTQFVAVSLVVL